MNAHMIVRYDGSDFHGFQRQAGLRTVQGELEAALEGLLGERVELSASSRTDAGVHAAGQSVSFRYSGAGAPPDRLAAALLRRLPADVSAVSSREAPEDFDARFSAKGKEYVYVCYRSAVEVPGLRRYATAVSEGLDAGEMSRAAALFEGERDFSSFGNNSGVERDPVKRICGARVVERGRFVFIRVVGSGFLYKMVRTIAGTLLEVGEGRRRAEDIPVIIEARNRGAAGRTAGAAGLHLARVFYGEERLEGALEGPWDFFGCFFPEHCDAKA